MSIISDAKDRQEIIAKRVENQQKAQEYDRMQERSQLDGLAASIMAERDGQWQQSIAAAQQPPSREQQLMAALAARQAMVSGQGY